MKGLIEAIEREGLKENVPQFNVGDTVKVGYRIIEGGKERIQNFEGVVIAKKHGGIRESFTVRRLSFGVGVEALLPPALPQGRLCHRCSRGQGEKGKALLSPRPYGQGSQGQGRHLKSMNGRAAPRRRRFFGKSGEKPFTILR